MWHFDSMHGPVAVAMAQVAGIAARLPVDRLEGSFLLPLALAFEREWRIRAVLSDGSSFNWWTPKKPNRTMVVARQLCLLTALLAFPWTVLGPFGALSFVDTSLCYKRWSCRRMAAIGRRSCRRALLCHAFCGCACCATHGS